MPKLYQRLVPGLAPPWMQGPNMGTLLEAIGSQLDCNAQQVLDGRVMGNPYSGGALLADGSQIQCPPFVLPIHAEQRGITLYATEPEDSQRFRTSQWLQLHRRRGTHWGEIEHVLPYFLNMVNAGYAYPQITICFQDNAATPSAMWYRVDPSGNRILKKVTPSNFDYDNQAHKRTRWWAFLEMAGTGYTAPITYGSGHTYSDGSDYGQGGTNPFTAAMMADIVNMFQDWHSAHSWLAGVILVWAPASLDILGTPTQDADGRWSLPNGHWGTTVDPLTGKATRPYGFQWLLDSPG